MKMLGVNIVTASGLLFIATTVRGQFEVLHNFPPEQAWPDASLIQGPEGDF